MSTKAKIALVLFMGNVLIVSLFGAAIYYFQNQYSFVDFYKRLETRATIAASHAFEDNRAYADAVKALREDYLEKLAGEKDYILQIEKETSIENLSAKHNMPLQFLEDIKLHGNGRYKYGDTFYAGIKHTVRDKQYLVIVSADNYYASHHLLFLRNMLLWGVLFVIVLTTSLSLFFSKYIFNPIKEITDNVKQISTHNIHLRLEERKGNNEVSELASTFNDLLNRIETAFETQKNFISNASHELGTPLTTIIGEADVALIKERTPEYYREAMQNILQQAERLDQITKSLLFLAQTAYTNNKVEMVRLRIDELVWEVKETIDKLNPQNEIIIDSSLFPDDPLKLKVIGNKQLLHLAFANILSNACKYSHNKPVTLIIAATDSEVIIVVQDQGVGIPAGELQFIYDPFFRASNTHSFEGYGIGLPLSRNIVKLHHGVLYVSSVVHKGTTVQIKLPLANR